MFRLENFIISLSIISNDNHHQKNFSITKHFIRTFFSFSFVLIDLQKVSFKVTNKRTKKTESQSHFTLNDDVIHMMKRN